MRTHHEFDPERFFAATPQTEQGYGGFLGSQLKDPDVAVFVAEAGGEVVGYTYAGVEGFDYMSLRGPAGVLHDIVVDPTWRRSGVGRQLLDHALAFLKSHNVPRVVLSTATRNEAASASAPAARGPTNAPASEAIWNAATGVPPRPPITSPTLSWASEASASSRRAARSRTPSR